MTRQTATSFKNVTNLQSGTKKKWSPTDSNLDLASLTLRPTHATVILRPTLNQHSDSAPPTASDNAPKSVLSLIVAASDTEQVRRHIEKLGTLAKQRNVKIGNVYVVGMSTIGAIAGVQGASRTSASVPTGPAAKAWLDANQKILSESGLGNSEVVRTEQLYKRLDIRYSPTWVVRHLGRDYVYEGYTDPTRWFSKDGQFMPEASP